MSTTTKTKQKIRRREDWTDFDQVWAEEDRSASPPKRFKLFGEEHTYQRPDTPAGMLRLLELDRQRLVHLLGVQGQPNELIALTEKEVYVRATAQMITAAVPSLKPHEDKLMDTPIDRIEALIDYLAIKFGPDEEEEGEEGEDGPPTAEKLEGNLPESAGTASS